MFTALKLFFSTGLGKSVLLVGALLLIVGAAFTAGKQSGYEKGHQAGRDSRNEEVKHLNDNVIALSKLINDERLAQASKIKEVEAEAANAAVKTETKLQTQIRARDAVIANYEKVVPISVQQQCGLSIETVRAINQLIDKVNGEQNEPQSDKAGHIPDGGLGSPAADGVWPRPTEEAAGRRSAGTQERDGEYSSEDTGALQEAASDGGQGVQPERGLAVREHVADASR